MNAILTCLGTQHDHRLMALAAVICLLSVWATLAAYRRSLRVVAPYQGAWLATAAVLGGVGVWSTHFLSMLAYRPGPQIGFEIWLTLASLLIAISGFALGYGLHLGARRMATRAGAGLIIGAAIAAMHFTGMAALDVHAKLTWRYDLVAVAVICCLGLSTAAMILTRPRVRPICAFAVFGLLTLAILSLHFIAMSAIVLSPMAMTHADHLMVDHRELALLVTAVDALILSVTAAVMLMEQVGFRETLASLSEALDSAPSAIAFFNADGRLVFWNKGFDAALETVDVRPSENITFRQIRQAVLDAPWVQSQLPDKNDQGTPELLEALQTPDGRWVQLRAARTKDGGVIMVVNDITIERAARELADQANRTKSDFLANVSHEIRTPLNGVIGMAQVMALHPLDPEQRDRLNTIRASGEGLLSILNSVLDMAKIEAGRMEVEVHSFDLSEAVHAACDQFAGLAAHKDVGFEFRIAQTLSGEWRGDSARLRQVLANLAANAVKFTNTGKVVVACLAENDGVRFEVSDSGTGIAPMQLGRLFEKFTQGDSSISRRYGGTGLGLAISYQLVELMGGRLAVESEQGVGTVFRFTLPLQRPQAMPDAAPLLYGPPTEAADLWGEHRTRVLAVDDNPTNRNVVEAMLTAIGHEVTLAQSGPEALAAFMEADFDVVLMDIQMPGMSGVEAAQLMIKHRLTAGRAQTPILALTANVMTHQVEEYMAAGMSGVIAKPIVLKDLMSAIEDALTRDDIAA